MSEDFEDADIYLIGESHTDEGHAREEEAAIRRMKPRYVLSEGATQDEDQAQRETEKAGRNYTLGRTDEKVADRFEEYGGAIEQIEDELLEYCQQRREEVEDSEHIDSDGTIPSSREELYQTPWPDLDQKVIEKASDAVSEELIDEMDEYASFSAGAGSDPLEEDERIQTLNAVNNNLMKYLTQKASSKSSGGYRIRAAVHDLQQEGYQTELRGMDVDKSEALDGDADEVRETITSDEFTGEREDEMAASIAQAREEGQDTVMAIMGRSHLEGVKERLEQQGYTVAVDELESDPQDRLKGMAYGKEMLDRYSTDS